MKIVDSILKMNDKVLHFIACLVLTMTVGEIGALSAALTKEGADWLYKKTVMWVQDGTGEIFLLIRPVSCSEAL